MVQRLIDDIRKALDNNLYYVALVSALTLPDICAKAEYPAEISSRIRYIDWYNDRIGKYENCPDQEDEIMPYLSGEVMYSLRCAFLHEGNPNVNNEKLAKWNELPINQFILKIERRNELDHYQDYSEITDIYGQHRRSYTMDIRRICGIICRAAEAYYRDNKDKFVFNYKIVDWDKTTTLRSEKQRISLRDLAESSIRSSDNYLFEIRKYLQRNGVEYNSDAIASIREGEGGKKFTISDHIKAMVYSLMTNQTVWNRIVPYLDTIDNIFHDYDPEYIKSADPDGLAEDIFKIKCGNMSTRKQMRALKGNIEVLEKIEKEYGSVDNYVTGLSPDIVVKSLSKPNSGYKLEMMGEALVWEYLRNVGVDGVKPDTHVRRFLGGNRMGEPLVATPASIEDVYRQVEILSEETGLLKAEIDNLIWSFCAEGYGEICTVKPHCDRCPIRSKCAYTEFYEGGNENV